MRQLGRPFALGLPGRMKKKQKPCTRQATQRAHPTKACTPLTTQTAHKSVYWRPSTLESLPRRGRGMTHQERIRTFDSQGEAYKQAFQIFLDHTDQKRNAKRWLQEVVDRLPARRVFIDAGAGNGEVTKALPGPLRAPLASSRTSISETSCTDAPDRRGGWPADLGRSTGCPERSCPLLPHVLLHSSRGLAGAPGTPRLVDGASRRDYRGVAAPGEWVHEHGASLFRPPV